MKDSQQILQQIQEAQSIVITSHKSPDGDSIGSSMAMYHLLKKWGKEVRVVHPDPAPNFLLWIPDSNLIVDCETNQALAEELLNASDLILCLDYNDASRVGEEMQVLLEKSQAAKIMIDHHLNPSDFCQLVISLPDVGSTCELIYRWLDEVKLLGDIDEVIGQCIYLGIMTDTGSFRFPSVSAYTHRLIGNLLDKGVKHYLVHEAVYDTNTVNRIRLRGYTLSEKLVCLSDIPVAYASLTQDELNRFFYEKGDTEGLVNQILGIQGIQMAVLFVENEGKIKISFRSKGDYFVNELAKIHFQGGGHAYASGGVSFENMEQTIEKFVTFVKDFIPVK